MATYVNDLRLKEIATGDESGTWGDTTNTNLELIAEAFSYGTEAITTNADTHTTTIADGATDPGRSMYLKYTGTLDSACTITIGPNTISKMWFIENATSGSQNIIISQGSGANITIPPGDVKVVYSDGAGSGAAVVDAFASLSVVDLKVQDDLTVTDDLIVNGDIDLEGNMDVNGSLETDALSLNGTTVTSTAAEINLLDGSSANTVVNSKAVIYGSSGEVAGTLSTAAQPNITSLGTLTGFTSTGIDDNADALAITIDSSENVGIGLTNQANKLQVDGDICIGKATTSADLKSTLKMRGANGSNQLQVFDLVNDGENGRVDFKYNRAGGAAQTIMSFGATVGNVGIGTNNPSQPLTISKAGDLYIQINNSSAGFNTYLGTFTNESRIVCDGAKPIAFFVNGSRVVDFANGGNVGIGTTSPTQSLDTTGKIRIRDGGNTTVPSIQMGASGVDGLSLPTTNTVAFITNSTERMRLDSSGRVGIAQDAPGDFNAAADDLVIGNSGGDFGITIRTGTASNGSIHFADGTTGDAPNRGIITYDHSDDHMQFNVAAAERMRIDSSGRVGIGTSSPDVYGVHASQSSNSVYYKAVSGTVTSIYGSASALGTSLVGTTSNHSVSFYSNNLEHMRLHASGAIQSGASSSQSGVISRTTAPTGSQGLNITASVITGLPTTTPTFADNSSSGGTIFLGGNAADQYGGNVSLIAYGAGADGNLITFSNRSGAGTISEKVRINSSGDLLVGTTNNNPAESNTTGASILGGGDGRLLLCVDSNEVAQFNRKTSDGTILVFRQNAVARGSVSISGANTSYNTTSDARLKDVTGSARGLEVINELNPVSYNWKEDGKADEGLIAQEVLDIVPNAVSGSEEDMYQMDYSKLVVHLVAGMKEQQAQIEALQSEINLLKGE